MDRRYIDDRTIAHEHYHLSQLAILGKADIHAFRSKWRFGLEVDLRCAVLERPVYGTGAKFMIFATT